MSDRFEGIRWLRMMCDDAPPASTTRLRSRQVLIELDARLAECERLRAALEELAVDHARLLAELRDARSALGEADDE